jgi:hypothetical protein
VFVFPVPFSVFSPLSVRLFLPFSVRLFLPFSVRLFLPLFISPFIVLPTSAFCQFWLCCFCCFAFLRSPLRAKSVVTPAGADLLPDSSPAFGIYFVACDTKSVVTLWMPIALSALFLAFCLLAFAVFSRPLYAPPPPIKPAGRFFFCGGRSTSVFVSAPQLQDPLQVHGRRLVGGLFCPFIAHASLLRSALRRYRPIRPPLF